MTWVRLEPEMVGIISVHVKYCGVLDGPGGSCWAFIGAVSASISVAIAIMSIFPPFVYYFLLSVLNISLNNIYF
jgi:hypothetical protein